MLRLEHNDNLGRFVRMDDIGTIGVSTYTMLETLIRGGKTQDALALADYYHKELRIMHNILMTWGQDIVRFIVSRDTGAGNDVAHPVSVAICKAWWDFEFGTAPLNTLKIAIRSGNLETADRALERLWLEFKIPHDVLVAWINEMFAYLSQQTEETVLNSIIETHQSIWGDRYERWDQMTPWEKVALTVEGMRGHLSGTSRKGDVAVREEQDRFAISFDPCGTGGVLRRGDPETGREAYRTDGMNREPHEWTWGKTGVHWYCSHCAIAMEWLPGRRRGHPLRPLDHTLDHNAPCVWYVYKDETQTRDYHYPRTGLVKPVS
ncbi:MAG: hypothetical protein FJY97_00105 [candidate division Zixibacteria bacterium]|nr:hypothetical protein [candidate division Zixibacteria bacterium]